MTDCIDDKKENFYETFKGFSEASFEEIKEKLRASNGIQITEALFEETIQNSSRENWEPLYTLKEFEYKGKLSAYQIYINSLDETEAALKLVGSLSHWRKLCGLKWFINGRKECGFEGLSQWRKDMMQKDRSFAKDILIKQSKSGNIQAARALEKMAVEDYKELSKGNEKDYKSKKSDNRDDGLSFIEKYNS